LTRQRQTSPRGLWSCAKICDAYGKATLQRERLARRSGKATAIGQISLVAGLVLTAAASVSTLAALGS